MAGESRVTFTVATARPYHLVGKRLVVTGVNQYGEMQSYTSECLECVRIVEGQLVDRSGLVPVE